jgi:hypothetical protein
MGYGRKWVDYGGTCEPCPSGCGSTLRWENVQKGPKKERVLKCPKKCSPPKSAGESDVKGITPLVGFPVEV